MSQEPLEILHQQLASLGKQIEQLNEAEAKTRLAEKALRESEKRFRTLAEATDAMIFTLQGTRYIYVNPAAERVTGYSSAELLAMNYWDIAHPEFRELIRKRGENRQLGQKVTGWYEYKIIAKGGEERWTKVLQLIQTSEFTHQVQKNLRKVLYSLGSMGCKLFFPSVAEHHPQ